MVELIGKPKATHEPFTLEQQVAWLKSARQNCTSAREFALVDSLIGDLAKPKQSGCSWGHDKRGGFSVIFYISREHLQDLKMPQDDADTVSKLLARKDGASVMSGCALLMGHWIKQIKADQQSIINHVNETIQ